MGKPHYSVQVASEHLSCRLLPGVARMGTAISVMLLSDGLAFNRTSRTNRQRLDAVTLDASSTVLVQPALLVTDRPEVFRDLAVAFLFLSEQT